jgi:TonB-linked SusC/RagA family outer membrane protein
MKFIYVIALMLLGVGAAWAQEVQVRGTVIAAEDNTGLPGVNVLVKGTTVGTTTDAEGRYSLNVPDGNAVLVFSFIGYTPVEVVVSNRTTIDVSMESDIQQLGEVVIIGYGEQRKADLTGSVAIVNTDEMKKVSHPNMSTMLQGRVPGVQITTDGQPGADPVVRIRGIGSFGDTSPLYVVDGVIMGTTVRDFSPNDIESLQILKDASAAAIYGSRAANGVVIITTKSGKKNQPLRVDYSGYVGYDQVQKGVYDVMDAKQYGQYVNMAFENSGMSVPSGYDPTSPNYLYDADGTPKVNTNWQDAAFKTGVRQNHNINFSGGGEKNTYNVALDYFSQKGTMEGAGPNFDRYTARFKNTMDAKFLTFNTNIVYSHSDQDNMALSNANEFVQGLYGAQYPVMASALITPPTIKAYDPSTWVLDGKLAAASQFTYDSYGYGTYYDDVHGDLRVTNVLLTNSLLERNAKVHRLQASGGANVDFMDMFGATNSDHRLNYNLNLAYSITNVRDHTFIPAFIQSSTNYLTKSNEVLAKENREYLTSLVENTVTYDGNFGRSHLNVLVGQTFQRDYYHRTRGTGNTLSEPYYLHLNNADETASFSDENESYLLSYLGRILYEFDEKYLLTATVRRDASSRLSPADNAGIFPSVSAGWRLDRESFFQIPQNTINLLKVRGSYGELGITNLGPYEYMATMQRGDYSYSFGNEKVTGSGLSSFVNERLKWERKKTIDVGLDIELFQGNLEFNFDWYKSTSEDLHYGIAVPTQAGFTNESVRMNAATMVNSGLEFLVAYHNDKHAVKFDISANATTINNEVKKLGVTNLPQTNGYARTEVGREVGQFYGYVYEGIFQSQEQIDTRVNAAGNYVNQPGAQPGDVAYADLNNDGEITNLDQTYLGSGIPDLTFGFNARAEWKGFDLSVMMFGATGFQAVDFVDVTLRSSYGALNKSVDLLNAWTPENTNTDVPRVANRPTGAITNDMFSSRFIQNANYLKIANIQVGYNLPDRLFGGYLNRVRVYASAQNLAVFSKYRGYNVDFAGGTFTPGYNYASYPTPRSVMFGAQLSF